MFVRGITLSLTALLMAGVLGGTAEADRRRPPPPPPDMPDDYYPGPPIIRDIPGFRILFGDYALTEDEYDALYGRPRRHFDESYYDPAPAPPPRRRMLAPDQQDPQDRQQYQQAPKKSVSKPQVKPPAAAPEQKTAAAAAANKSPTGTLTCEKATSVVSGYGFSSVEAARCSGKIYSFNATRGGKNFSVKLDSTSGELTEVKKLP